MGGLEYRKRKALPQYIEPSIAHLFDLKMGYRQSDDVFTPYLYPRYRSFLRSSITPKIGGITMFVSSLFNQSRRLEYIQSLHKHFPIDSFGRVMKNKSLIRDYGIATKRETIAQYYFTIAFENSITEDYVTEKFYEPLLMGSVPIYMGAPNVDVFAPGDHCFINVRDFDNPKHLSEYLHYLIATPDEYQSYFHWKELPYKASFEELLDRISSPVVIRLIDAINRFIQ